MEEGNETNMMKILDKIQKCEAQKQLLETTIANTQLLNTQILSSLQPKVGKQFKYDDLEKKKEEQLMTVRKQLLSIAIEEKEREIKDLEPKLKAERERLRANTDNTEIL